MWIWSLDQEHLGGRNGNPLQYSCLESHMDRGTWWATVHRVAQSQTWLKRLSTVQGCFTFGVIIRIMQLWNSCACLLLDMCGIYIGIYLGVDLSVDTFTFNFSIYDKLFSKRLFQFILHQPFMIVPTASPLQQHLAFSIFLILVILVGVHYHLFFCGFNLYFRNDY